MSEEIKIKYNVPMFQQRELEIFDEHIHDIIEEYSKLHLEKKDQILTQRIIMKQEEEIEELKTQLQQKENIIKEVREFAKLRKEMYERQENVVGQEVIIRLLNILDKGE